MPHTKESSVWGPDNPHPLSQIKTELIWEGKYDEYGNRRPISLPASPLPLAPPLARVVGGALCLDA